MKAFIGTPDVLQYIEVNEHVLKQIVMKDESHRA
jgi:hypothetical protein